MDKIFSDLFSAEHENWYLIVGIALLLWVGNFLWWQGMQASFEMDEQAATMGSSFRRMPNERAAAVIEKQLRQADTGDLDGDFEQIDSELLGL